MNQPSAAWRSRERAGLAMLAAMALGIALAAILGAIGIVHAASAGAALIVIGAGSAAVLRSGAAPGMSRTAFVGAQTAAVFLLLAWLTQAVGSAHEVIGILYLPVTIYAVVELGRAPLAALAVIALATHGTALFMLVDRGQEVDAAAWSQFGGLAAALGFSVYAAGAVQRLRGRLAEARWHLHDAGRAAAEDASRDALTGTLPHRQLIEALEREISRAERAGKPLSVARVDLDRLGRINESHGAAAGDVALKRFVAAAGSALRDADVFGRYGGKEFFAVMPDTDVRGALVAAERIRAAVAREAVPEVDGRKRLACTLGIAEFRRGDNTRLLIGRAEAALTYAKAAGRDRFVALDGEGEPVSGGTP